MKDRPILEVKLELVNEKTFHEKGNMYSVKYHNRYGYMSIEYMYGKDELDATIKAQKWLRDPDNGE